MCRAPEKQGKGEEEGASKLLSPEQNDCHHLVQSGEPTHVLKGTRKSLARHAIDENDFRNALVTM